MTELLEQDNLDSFDMCVANEKAPGLSTGGFGGDSSESGRAGDYLPVIWLTAVLPVAWAAMLLPEIVELRAPGFDGADAPAMTVTPET